MIPLNCEALKILFGAGVSYINRVIAHFVSKFHFSVNMLTHWFKHVGPVFNGALFIAIWNPHRPQWRFSMLGDRRRYVWMYCNRHLWWWRDINQSINQL